MLNSPSHGGLPTCAVKKAVQRYKYYSKQQKVLRKNTHLSLLQIYTEQTYCTHKYIIYELFFCEEVRRYDSSKNVFFLKLDIYVK